MTNRLRAVLHPGSGSSRRVRRVRPMRFIRVSLGAKGYDVLAGILVAATPCASDLPVGRETTLRLGGVTVAWCDTLTPPDDAPTPSVRPRVPLTLQAYCTPLCYLILLRIWSRGDSSPLGE